VRPEVEALDAALRAAGLPGLQAPAAPSEAAP
jgi:hypothetical protein